MPFNFGAFAGGLSQGINEGTRLKLMADESKLKSKMLEHQLKIMEFDQAEKQRQAQESQQQAIEVGKLAEMVGQGVRQQVTPGFESEAQQMSVAPTTAFREANPNEIRAQAFRATPGKQVHQLTERLFPSPTAAQGPRAVSPGGALVDPTGKVLFQNPAAAREGVGVESQTFSRIIRENPGADLATIREIYNREVGKTAGTRAGSVEQGKTDVRGTPQFQSTERAVSQARAEGTTAGKPLGEAAQAQVAQLESLLTNTLPTIRKNFSSNYLGPVRGTDIAFETRRKIGSVIGSPVKDNETQFRLALTDAGDMLLRARSGAQINEQEYDRLKGILPKPTDEPGVFSSALSRFETELRSVLTQKIRTGTTPRSQLQSGAKLRFNPQTGKIE